MNIVLSSPESASGVTTRDVACNVIKVSGSNVGTGLFAMLILLGVNVTNPTSRIATKVLHATCGAIK